MKHKSVGIFPIVSALLLLFALFIAGCDKKEETSSPSAKESTVDKAPAEKTIAQQPETESEFVSAPDVSIGDLKEIKIADLDIKDPPSFVRRIERTDNKDTLKMGNLTLGGLEYLVLLGEDHSYGFHIREASKDHGPYWWGSWSLHSKHVLDGKYYEFMLIENGSKIAGRPYTGQFGTLKLGKGSRTIEKMEMSGSILQAGNVAAPVGTIAEHWPEPVAECSIPVGDYTAYIMSVVYDDLKISISNNYYTNVQGLPSMKNKVYGMHIRKDKPYVLDFSNKPTIIFETPKKDGATYSLGDEIKFSAVLIDPKLDIMIRGLDDTSQKIEKEYKDNVGNVIDTAKVSKSLDPKVVVTRADGEVVGEGSMPFG